MSRQHAWCKRRASASRAGLRWTRVCVSRVQRAAQDGFTPGAAGRVIRLYAALQGACTARLSWAARGSRLQAQ